ncbi:MAG: MFS transporter [Blastocatellia bacterium]
MAAACGIVVANLYYNQPLLADMGRSLAASLREVGLLPMLTQMGYALGLFLFVPLGDTLERRRLILILIAASALSLAMAALAPSFLWLAVASLAIGVTSITAQLLIPFAAQLTKPDARGRVVGLLIGGILIGVLLARTVSGMVGSHFGWQAMYWIAAALMIALAVALAKLLPRSEPLENLSYRELMRSVWALIVKQAVLREAAITGAMLFGAFSAFWATLVFFLEKPPYQYGSRAAGLFGLVGAVGAGSAPFTGRLTDRIRPKVTLGLALALTAASFVLFWLLSDNLWALIVGVILMDLGVQAGHIANQTRIYAVAESAHSRVNMVYMVAYFLGGSLGSTLGAYAMSFWGWSGVCGVALLMLAAAFLAYFAIAKN